MEKYMLRPQTLFAAIQCLAAKTKEIDQHLTRNNPTNAADLEQLLLTFDLAADDLKSAYEAALDQYEGLPPYAAIPQLPE